MRCLGWILAGTLIAGGVLGGEDIPGQTASPAAPVPNTPPAPNPPTALAPTMVFGEKLTYSARWNGFPIGVIHGRVWPFPREFNGRKTAMLELQIEGNDFLSLYYPVSTTLKSFVDIQTGASLLFRRKTREGNYRGNDRVLYQYNLRNALGQPEPLALVEQFAGGIVARTESRRLPGFVCDPLALVWHLRVLPLALGTETPPISLSDRYNDGTVTFTVAGQENVTLPGIGAFPCWRLIPRLTNFSSSNVKAEFAGLWVAVNGRRILRAEIRLPFGMVTVQLTAAEPSLTP